MELLREPDREMPKD